MEELWAEVEELWAEIWVGISAEVEAERNLAMVASYWVSRECVAWTRHPGAERSREAFVERQQDHP